MKTQTKVINLRIGKNAKPIPITQPKGYYLLCFKFEHKNYGPLYWFGGGNKSKNFLDSEQKDFTGKPSPQWFSLHDAKNFAKFFGVELETV